jgi:hypothetical protein
MKRKTTKTKSRQRRKRIISKGEVEEEKSI